MSLLYGFVSILIHPFFWVLALLLIALFAKKRRYCLVLISSAIVVMLTFSNPLLYRFATQSWESPPVPITEFEDSSPYDYGIVLGGFTRMHAIPLDRLHLNEWPNRFSQAIELYHQQKVKQLVIVSGATTSGSNPANEAEMARATAIRFGVPEEDVFALTTSLNTFENAVEFAEFLGTRPESDSLLLLTSGPHMPRALGCFQKQGMTPDIFPTDHRTNYDTSTPGSLGSLLIPQPATFTAWKTLLREWLAIATYKFQGRI